MFFLLLLLQLSLQIVFEANKQAAAGSADSSDQLNFPVLKSRSVRCKRGKIVQGLVVRFNVSSQYNEIVSVELVCRHSYQGMVVEGRGTVKPPYALGVQDESILPIITKSSYRYPVLVGVAPWVERTKDNSQVLRGIKYTACKGSKFFSQSGLEEVWQTDKDCWEDVLQWNDSLQGDYQNDMLCGSNQYLYMFQIAYVQDRGIYDMRGIGCQEIMLEDESRIVKLQNQALERNPIDMQCQGIYADYCGTLEEDQTYTYSGAEIIPQIDSSYPTCQLAGTKELTPPGVIQYKQAVQDQEQYQSDVQYKYVCDEIAEPTIGWHVLKAADKLGVSGFCLTITEECSTSEGCKFVSAQCNQKNHNQWFYVHYVSKDQFQPIAILETGKYAGWCLTLNQQTSSFDAQLTIGPCSTLEDRWYIALQYGRLIHLSKGQSAPNLATIQTSQSNIGNFRCLVLQGSNATLDNCSQPISVDTQSLEGEQVIQRMSQQPRLPTIQPVTFLGNWTADAEPFAQFLTALEPVQILQDTLGWDIQAALTLYESIFNNHNRLSLFVQRPAWCSWKGVGCDHNNRITYIKIATGSHIPLSGYLPSSIFLLQKIRALVIQDSDIGGSLPEIENSSQIVGLFLANNQFEGTVPYSWPQKMTKLKYLQLWQNSLEGEVPLNYFFQRTFSGKDTVLMLNQKNDSNLCVSKLFNMYVNRDIFSRGRFLYDNAGDSNDMYNEPLSTCPTNILNIDQIDQFQVHYSRKFKILPMTCKDCVDQLMQALRLSVYTLIVNEGVNLSGGEDGYRRDRGGKQRHYELGSG
eukprot:TRINITY_DN16576_c0_g2_i2.p1 TRINITY_DN16576_c0_g2~~TRINITY_DN16576_c0_g2_i2.p1  ORF type:complete len:802 (-),score=25.43 TRINITY_DN16576_c0_g2_i2:33-2438(-)